MGDAESCLFRQQTREVREKPLINYRFLSAAASVVLRDLAAAELPCPAANAAIAASPASLASPGPTAVGLATQVPRARGPPLQPPPRAALRHLLASLWFWPPRAPPSPSPLREGQRVSSSALLATELLFPWRRKGPGLLAWRQVCVCVCPTGCLPVPECLYF